MAHHCTHRVAHRVVAALVVAGALTAPVAQAQPVPDDPVLPDQPALPAEQVPAEQVLADPPVLTDEDQIRDVLTRQADASAAWDLAAAAELTCTGTGRAGLPSTGLFGADVEATLRGDPFGRSLAEQLSGATAQLRDALPQTSTRVSLAAVDNIVVAGDTATADVTMTYEIGTNPPQTQITRTTLLRQDGRWCTSI